jgi:hypothetical protein
MKRSRHVSLTDKKISLPIYILSICPKSHVAITTSLTWRQMTMVNLKAGHSTNCVSHV